VADEPAKGDPAVVVGVDERYGVIFADPSTWPETDDPEDIRRALASGGIAPTLRTRPSLPTDYSELTP
jgi:hypothetical protein